jgi:DNA-binding transcriptional LysR family regulator
MDKRAEFERIDLHLIRVLLTLISERSVSRAAVQLQSTQPAVSAQLKRLRELTGDPLLVRSGNGMTATAAALQLVAPAATVLHQAELVFSGGTRNKTFDPATSNVMFRAATSDYLDPYFVPHLVSRLKRLAPGVRLELEPLTNHYDYRRSLAKGEVDLVIGNWLEPPAELHLGPLFTDKVVCLVAREHPLSDAKAAKEWTIEQYLADEHVAPMPLHPGAIGIIDEHLSARGLNRNERTLAVKIVQCPVPFPPLIYYQLWHDLTHRSPQMQWFREQVRTVARELGASVAEPARKLARRASP